MMFQEFQSWLQAQVFRKEYQQKVIQLNVSDIKDFKVKDSQDNEYQFIQKIPQDIKLNYPIELKEYNFLIEFDLTSNEIIKLSLDSANFIIPLEKKEYDPKIIKLAKNYTLSHAFKHQIENIDVQQIDETKESNAPKIIQDINQDQAAIEDIVFTEPIHIFSEINEMPRFEAQAPVTVKVVKEREKAQVRVREDIQASQIEIPDRWQQEADEWIKNRKKQRFIDAKYYQKLSLLALAISKSIKNQVIHNLLKYPYQPTEELKRKMIPCLLNASSGPEPTKKVMFKKAVIDHLLKD